MYIRVDVQYGVPGSLEEILSVSLPSTKVCMQNADYDTYARSSPRKSVSGITMTGCVDEVRSLRPAYGCHHPVGRITRLD
jgi:hypothetical protein